MLQKDTLQRFIIDKKDIRGEVVHLNESYQKALTAQDYPPVIRKLLADAMATVALLSATLKFKGRLSIQLQGGDIISLLLVQTTDQQEIRATIKWDGNTKDKSLLMLIKNAKLVITIEPDEGKRYQGIVPIEGEAFHQFIEKYFERSEQIMTRIWLASDDQQSVGFLLQQMPGDGQLTASPADWEHFSILTDTIKSDEMLNLGNDELLYRLYHGESVKMFDLQQIQYVCGCSQEKCENAIISLGPDEIGSIIEEDELVEMKCDFCDKNYKFDTVDLTRLKKISAEKVNRTS